MKRTLIAAAAIVVAAVPATSSAGTSVRDGEAASRGAQDLKLSFLIRTVDGEATQIREFEFKRLTAVCESGGAVDVKGQLNTMKVNDAGKFDGKASDGSGKVVVDGVVKNRKNVKGTIRAVGDFASSTGCDSGKVKWETTKD